MRRKLSDMGELAPREDELADLEGRHSHLLLLLASYGTLGQDANGRPLWSEMIAFLDEHRVVDADERRRWQALWGVVAREKARALAIKLEAK